MNFKSFEEGLDKDQVKKETKEILKEIGELQYKMFAEQKNSLLIVLQGIDASGKDGLTRGLLNYCNPVGISTKSFKKPTPEEYAHDFLWRVHQHCPPKGFIQVFIRSHYEDILVPTVEKLFPPELIEERYHLINNFEKLITHNGTRVLKFFLNVSKDVQEERLKERIENKRKHWKHSDGDWDTRKKFDQYMEVYKSILTRCNATSWYIIPADTNWQKLYFVSKVVLDALKSMDIKWPELETEVFKK
ncbi:MAG: polyphosphate kinase [Bacteroidales bacterium]|nr:polyphosphate kinase [Bacteroidales bacterium]